MTTRRDRPFPWVIFLDILDQYCFNVDLTCQFKCNINKESKSEQNDFVAVFKLGWSQITDYVAIQVVEKEKIQKDQLCTATFHKNDLPRDTVDLYQICYISGNELLGASTPFQLCATDNPAIASNHFPSKILNSFDPNLIKYQSIDKDKEISKLKEENAILKESLRILLADKDNGKEYSKDLQDIQEMVESLKSMLLVHDADINMLKSKIKEGGEEYKKLYIEKYKMQKKYEKLKMACLKMQPYIKENSLIDDFNFDIEELPSIPSFPSIFK